jgi:hypothetical protein
LFWFLLLIVDSITHYILKQKQNMKSKFTPGLFLLMIAGTLAVQSCQKTETLKDLSATASNKNTSGGGGASGSGHNGGGGGGGTITPTNDPSLAPADTTTSQLPVGDILTVGRWKVTSFVQGNDNLGSQFASYIFTFNSDGNMTADDNNGNQTIGYWHYQEAIFYYGIPVYGSSPYGFTMTIGSGLPLTSLNENYFISKKTLTTINIDSINPNENAHITLSKML